MQGHDDPPRQPQAEQGQLQGANASLTGISASSPARRIFTLAFAYFVQPGHAIAEAGAPFLLAAVILFGAAVWGWFATRDETDDRES